MLIDELTGAAGGVDVDAVVGGVDVSIDIELAFDASGLEELVEELAPPELSAAITAAATIAEALSDRAGFDPDAVLAPLRARLALAASVTGIDLDALGAGLTTDLGWQGLDARLRGVSAALDGSALGEIVETAAAVVPGLDLRATLGEVAPTAAGVVALVQVLGALLTYSTVSADLERGAAGVHRVLRADDALAAGARLSLLAGDLDLVAAIRAADPQESLDVERLGRRVVEFIDAVADVAESWSASLAFAEAAAVGVDVDSAAVQLELAASLLASADLRATTAAAARVRSLLDGVTSAPLPDPMASVDAAIDQGLELLEAVRAAVGGVDATTLVAPVADGLTAALAPVTSLTTAVGEVGSRVTTGLRQLQAAVEAVDLSPVASQLRAALQPVEVVLDAVTDTIGAAEAAITAVASEIQAVLDQIRDAVAAAADVVRGALAGVETVLSTADLAGIKATIEAGLGRVADALRAARLDPYFDAAGDAIDTTADVVNAVPFDLLPTDVQQEVVDAVRPIKQIDIESIATGLRQELAAIIEALDADVLVELDAAYQEVLEVLEGLDPRRAVTAFEQGPFADLRAEVERVDPRSLLSSVEAALGDVRSVLSGVDLDRDLLHPLEAAFDSVRQQLERFDPAVLLADARAEVDVLRQSVTDSLQIDGWEAQLERLRDGLAGLLGRLDPAAVARLLDTTLVRRLDAQAAPTQGLLGTLLAGLAQASGLHAGAGSLVEVLGWLGEVDGAAVVRGRLTGASGDLQAAASATAQLDPQPVVVAAGAQHRRLLDAVRSHPTESLLRTHLEPLLLGVEPDRAFGRLSANRDRAHARVRASAVASATLTASARGEITAATDGLVEALRPVTSLGDWGRTLLARFGVADPDAPLAALLRTVWTVAGPDRLLPHLAGVASSLRDLALEVVDALAAPLRSAMSDVRAAIELLDLAPVVDLAGVVHGEVRAAVDAVDPAVLLGPVLADARTLVDELSSFDPLGPVRPVIDDLEATIDQTFDTLRPTVLFGDAIDVYELLLELAAGLDVRDLLDPALTILDDLRVQLDEGLETTATALARLQAALPGEVSDSAVSGQVSVDVGVGVSL